MLSDLIMALISAIQNNDEKARKKALRALESVGVDEYTALYLIANREALNL